MRSGLQFVINIMTCLICIISHSTELRRMRFCNDAFDVSLDDQTQDVSEVECVYCMCAFNSISFIAIFRLEKKPFFCNVLKKNTENHVVYNIWICAGLPIWSQSFKYIGNISFYFSTYFYANSFLIHSQGCDIIRPIRESIS